MAFLPTLTRVELFREPATAFLALLATEEPAEPKLYEDIPCATPEAAVVPYPANVDTGIAPESAD